MGTETKIRQFLKERFPAYHDDLGFSEPLDGLVDSLGLYELVTFIEQEFSIVIPNEKFSPRHFSSIESIVNTIQKYQQ
jgi:acyl carrier protein